MKSFDRILSISILSALLLIAAPLASAQETDGGNHFFGRPGMGRQFRQHNWRGNRGGKRLHHIVNNHGSEALKAALAACKESDDRRACKQQLRTDYGDEISTLKDQAKAKRQEVRTLVQQTCGERPGRDADQSAKEAFRTCAQGVFEANGIEKPWRGRRGKMIRGFVRNHASDALKAAFEACKDSDDRRACMQQVRADHGDEIDALKEQGKDRRQEIRKAIRACRATSETREEFRTCLQRVRNVYHHDSDA